MITKEQHDLINKCINDGYGTAKFALSVRKSGKCSDKQYATMVKLHSAAEYRRNNKSYKSSRQASLDIAFGDFGSGHGEGLGVCYGH